MTQRRRRRAPSKKTGTLSHIILDLEKYTEEHPDVIETIPRYFGQRKKDVKHIPVHKVIKILDEVVTHRHGGTWEYTIHTLDFKVDCAVVCVDLTVTDRHGRCATRPGVGAADIYGRERGKLTTDSVDNAAKTAMSNALKKASSQFKLGISMWDRDDDKDEPAVIEDKGKVIQGGAQIKSETPERKEEPRKLPDELGSKIVKLQEKFHLTEGDIVNILKDHPTLKESQGKTSWLLEGNQEEKVDRLCKAIESEVGAGNEESKQEK